LGLPLRTYMVRRYLLYVHLLKTHDIFFLFSKFLSFDIWPVLLAHLLLHIFLHLFHIMQPKRSDRFKEYQPRHTYIETPCCYCCLHIGTTLNWLPLWPRHGADIDHRGPAPYKPTVLWHRFSKRWIWRS